MRSLRRTVSDSLVAWGATTELDRREIWVKARQSGVRPSDAGFVPALGLLDLLSTAAIRLGFLIMPARLPDPRRGSDLPT